MIAEEYAINKHGKYKDSPLDYDEYMSQYNASIFDFNAGLLYATPKLSVQVKEEEIREKIDNILLSITPVAKFDGEKLDAWINLNSRRNVSDELVKLFLETNK